MVEILHIATETVQRVLLRAGRSEAARLSTEDKRDWFGMYISSLNFEARLSIVVRPLDTERMLGDASEDEERPSELSWLFFSVRCVRKTHHKNCEIGLDFHSPQLAAVSHIVK